MKPQIRTPYFEVGVKNYIYGDTVLEYAIAADKAAEKYDIDVLFIAPAVEIRRICENTKNMMFDFTANLYTPAITEGIKTVGVDRFLYGTDLPIAVMRMYRIVENGDYFNVVPKGYYGDVTGQAHMREEDNDQISLMAYEQLLAFKRSAAELKLSDTDVEKILYSNAKKLCNSMK